MFDLPFDSCIDIDIIHNSTYTDIKFQKQDYFPTMGERPQILALAGNLIEHAGRELQLICHLILPMLAGNRDRLIIQRFKRLQFGDPSELLVPLVLRHVVIVL